MDVIFRHTGTVPRGEAANGRILRAAAQYAAMNGVPFDPAKEKILRTENRKPYFESGIFQFSITHSWDTWMAVFTREGSIGIDIQFAGNIDSERLADRFYADDEAEFVRSRGDEAFYQLWVRKEAYGKLTGNGLKDRYQSVLAKTGEDAGGTYYFTDIPLGDDVFCSVCRRHEGEIRIVELEGEEDEGVL